ncbi:MAG TPA: PAS domain S-box protein [Ignavibacteriaceae bacterium]|nr:PAS domain S-box protein [Ignavibacteriaceae bacterium]
MDEAKKIKILLIEDLPTDAQLAEYEIKKTIPNYELIVVDNKDDYIFQLENFSADIIISDFKLPAFDGLSALKIQLEKCPTTPFIILTGSMNEDTAVECMKAGAVDYVIKEHIRRLGPALKNALEHKENKVQKLLIERRLIESDERYQRLTENARDLIYRYEFFPERKFAYVSPIVMEVTGYTQEEHYSDPDLGVKIIYPPDRELLNSLTTDPDVIKKPIILRWIKKDGQLIWVEQRNVPIFDANNNLIAIEGIARDITESKKAEEELRLLNRAIEQTPVSIVITNEKGNIEYINKSFIEKCGYSKEEIINQNPRILKSGYQSEKYYEELWRQIINGNTWAGEILNKKQNGELYWENATISPVHNDEGKITHFVGVKEDITEKKKMIQELIEAKEKAEEMNRIKSQFFANMSHEFRTPMNGILGMTNLLLDNNNDEDDTKELLGNIITSGKRLMTLLDTVLLIANLESKYSKTNKIKVELGSIAKELSNEYLEKTSAKGIGFNLKLPQEQIFVDANYQNMKLVLIHLLDNAVKFTKEGKIELELKTDFIDEIKYAVIVVRDTGIGIDSKNLSVIFDDFRQVSEGLSRTYEGSGLGLSLIKRIVTLSKGKILVDSELDDGSTFTVIIPSVIEDEVFEINNTEFKSSVTYSKIQNKKPHVLIVEDNFINKLALERYVKEICTSDSTTNGQSAIDLATRNHYDIILMDINLGLGLSGVDATKEIRKIPAYENTPIVAVTGYSMIEDKENFLSEGFTHFLAKPFDKVNILDLINELIEK